MRLLSNMRDCQMFSQPLYLALCLACAAPLFYLSWRKKHIHKNPWHSSDTFHPFFSLRVTNAFISFRARTRSEPVARISRLLIMQCYQPLFLRRRNNNKASPHQRPINNKVPVSSCRLASIIPNGKPY